MWVPDLRRAAIMTMARSRVVTVALALLAGSALFARQEPAGQKPQFRVDTHTVPVYATVLDPFGHLVTDLKREDFQILDNGVPQPLTSFESGTQPITVVMMLDRSGSVEDRFLLVEQAATEFVNHLTSDDRARIGSFAERIQIDPPAFTSDRDQLLEIIRHDLQPIGPTPLWNATNVAITALSGQPGRRVVLVFTDGHDAPLHSRQNTSFAEVRERTQSEEVMVYGIGLMRECAPPAAKSGREDATAYFQRRPGQRGGGSRGGPPPTGRSPRGPGVRMPGRPPLPYPGRGVPRPPTTVFEPRKPSGDFRCEGERPDPNLRALTEIGGGGYFELRSAQDLSATFARVADELHRQYLLAFVAPQNDGVLHRLEVKVDRPGVTVRARTGYVASK